MKTLQMLFVGAFLIIGASSFARPLPAAGRFVTLQQGEIEVAADLTLDLSKGRAGDGLSVDTGYYHDRHGGISFAYGILDEVEFGAAISAAKWDRILGSEFGGLDLYGTWGFLPILGLEVAMRVQGGSRAQDIALVPGVRIGIPFRFALIEEVLAVFSRTDFTLAFRPGETGADWFTDAGATFNLFPWLFAEGYVGFAKALRGAGARPPLFGGPEPADGRFAIPVGLGAGATLWRRLDLFAAFNLEDLRHRAADARTFTMTVRFRL